MIAHLNTALTWRGGEQQTAYLIQGLVNKKIPQLLICQPDSELEKRITSIPKFPIKIRGEWDITAIKKIIEVIDENKVSLIHAHTAHAHSVGLLIKFFRPELKLVVSRRVDFSIAKNFFSKLKYTSDRVDQFLAVSNTIRNILVRDGVNPEKVVTVYSGIDLKLKKKTKPFHLRKEFGIGKAELVIGNIAALVDHKDQKTLIKSISLLSSRIKCKLLIVGEGELEEELKQLVSDLRLESKVCFTGFRKDVDDILSILDVFVMSSKEEGLGTSVLDAMAFGLPVVITKGGGLVEMIEHEKGGLISDIKDSVRLAENLTRVLEDKQLRLEFGKYNLEAVKRFSFDNTIEKTIKVYQSLTT
ncbi:MAG: glycosyltransferase family 4 protein [Leptospiraceae bacterium]|nr:glycosyltransferase family 4 protein [Leptospiraceae bacterium]